MQLIPPSERSRALYVGPPDPRQEWFVAGAAGSSPSTTAAYVEVDDPSDSPRRMRTFPSGATRSADQNKPDYEGFLSPLVLERYARYMSKHRQQADGALRASDNWQKGIPRAAYMKSAWRHFMAWWGAHRMGLSDPAVIEEALCAHLFNVMGYLHEVLQQSATPRVVLDGASSSMYTDTPVPLKEGIGGQYIRPFEREKGMSKDCNHCYCRTVLWTSVRPWPHQKCCMCGDVVLRRSA